MPLFFPTSLGNFFEQLPIQEVTPDLTEAYDINETGYGEILTANLGSRLWRMDVSLRNGNYADLEKCRALLNVYRQPGRTFFAHAIPAKFPQRDPTGSILGARVVRLQSVNANMRELVLSGLPPAYQLMPGDCLSFQYGSDTIRYAFHQIVSIGVANASGITGSIEVTPNIRVGYKTNAVVQLVRPYFKGIIIPGSVNMGSSGQRETKGISFSITQTLRN